MKNSRKWSGYTGWMVALILAIVLFFTLPVAKELRRNLLRKGEHGLRQTLSDIPGDALYFVRQLLQPRNEVRDSSA